MSLATDDLFSADTLADAPLAERLRPRHLDEVVGQSHLLGPGKPLRLAIESGHVHSMVFWGPPGTGKTTGKKCRISPNSAATPTASTR